MQLSTHGACECAHLPSLISAANSEAIFCASGPSTSERRNSANSDLNLMLVQIPSLIVISNPHFAYDATIFSSVRHC